MLDFVTNLEINIVVGAVALIAGVLFSQKIKDWFKGIPSQLRVAITNVEADALAKIKAAQAAVLAELAPAAPAPKTPLPSELPPAAPVAVPAAVVAAAAPAAPVVVVQPVAAAPAPAPAPAAEPVKVALPGA